MYAFPHPLWFLSCKNCVLPLFDVKHIENRRQFYQHILGHNAHFVFSGNFASAVRTFRLDLRYGVEHVLNYARLVSIKTDSHSFRGVKNTFVPFEIHVISLFECSPHVCGGSFKGMSSIAVK